MKRGLFLMIALSSLLYLSSCGNEHADKALPQNVEANNINAGNSSTKTIHLQFGVYPKGSKDHIITIGGHCDIQEVYNGAITIDSAKKAIMKYDTTVSRDRVTTSFIFDAVNLRDYLDSCSMAGLKSKAVEFNIASDPATNTNFLLISSIDSNANHMYLADMNKNEFAFTSTSSSTISVNFSAATMDTITDFYYGAATIDSATSWITAYKNSPAKGQPEAWMYELQSLNNYISTAVAAKATRIQLIPCLINGSLSLIINALDKNDKHMVFMFQSHACILENCNPCPICAINPFGS